MKRTVFNNYHISKTNPYKNWYGVIDIGEKSYLYLYPYQTKNRSQAENWMKKKAKETDSKLVAFGAIK